MWSVGAFSLNKTLNPAASNRTTTSAHAYHTPTLLAPLAKRDLALAFAASVQTNISLRVCQQWSSTNLADWLFSCLFSRTMTYSTM